LMPDVADGPVLPAVRVNLHTPKSPAMATVVTNRLCTSPKASSFIRHVEFDVQGTDLEGAWRAGQSFGVLPPGEDARGKPHKLRLYSIASPTEGEDGKGRLLATTVKRMIDEHWDDHRLFLGVASNYLCNLQEGDQVQLTGPAGKRFLLPRDQNAHHYIFLATGTGVAPFRGMVMDLLARGCPNSITLIVGSPYQTDLPYDVELRELDARYTNFRYLPAVSRHAYGSCPPMYAQDRLLEAGFDAVLNDERTLLYVCGIAGMEVGIFKVLASRLDDEARGRFIEVAPEALADVEGWTRSSVKGVVRPTGRMFIEVY
ncbi:MAG: hypothetical protein KDA28_16895, partial [Phycisphaerales bacterium]|nr:hypothetical protein [Phycisphaerales bacterium]